MKKTPPCGDTTRDPAPPEPPHHSPTAPARSHPEPRCSPVLPPPPPQQTPPASPVGPWCRQRPRCRRPAAAASGGAAGSAAGEEEEGERSAPSPKEDSGGGSPSPFCPPLTCSRGSPAASARSSAVWKQGWSSALGSPVSSMASAMFSHVFPSWAPLGVSAQPWGRGGGGHAEPQTPPPPPGDMGVPTLSYKPSPGAAPSPTPSQGRQGHITPQVPPHSCCAPPPAAEGPREPPQ